VRQDEEPLASIDELLAGPGTDQTLPVAEQPAPAGAGPGPVARAAAALFWAALVSALCAAAVFVVLLGLGYDVSYVLLFFAFFALVSLRRALRRIVAPKLLLGAPPAAPGPAPVPRVRPRPAAPGDAPLAGDPHADGLQLALSRWQSRLSWSQKEPDRFTSQVHPRLADIADERLRQRHGVTRTGDPHRARQLMGERLWTFLYSPLSRTPNPRELAAVVEDMERL
jgi:hypothetical protein